MSTARPALRCALSTHFIRPSRHRLNIPDMDLDTWNAPQPCPRSRSAGQRCIEQIAALLEGPGRRRSDPRGGTVAALPHALRQVWDGAPGPTLGLRTESPIVLGSRDHRAG